MPDPTVEISTSGRGGSIIYREGAHSVKFDWEFALPPALALIFGTTAQHWESSFPWASGRQREIYQLVANEVTRQRAPGSAFEMDLDTGTLTVLMAGFGGRTGAQNRVTAAKVLKPTGNTDAYDVALIKRMDLVEQKKLVELISSRGQITGRDVEALAAIDTTEARAAVDVASLDHLSIDTRLAAAEVMNLQGRLPGFDTFLARQIRQLSTPANGLQRALQIAGRHSSETVKQALLWASYNSTECAPHCAALLLALAGVAKEPFDDQVKLMLQKLDLHNSYFERKAAFDKLCTLVKMELDNNPPE